MKKNIIRLVSFIFIVLISVIVVGKMFLPRGKVGFRQGQLYTPKGLYELKDNSIDVLFVGSSSVYKSISPMQLYEEYGITSYDYAMSSARVFMNYYFLKDALKSQKPKIVFVDVSTAYYINRETEPMFRKSIDYMRMSDVKLEMMNDDVFDLTFEDKVSILFPLLRYHDRWNLINPFYYTDNYHSITKGFVLDSKFKPYKKGFKYMNPKDETITMDEDNLEYMIKFVELCKENNIEVILSDFPNAKSWSYKNAEDMKKFAKEYDVKYLELNTDKYGLDWKHDTGDEGLHTNIFGAEKVTGYIGKYLNENYDLPNHKGEKEYKVWDDDIEKYHELMKKAKVKANKRMEKLKAKEAMEKKGA